MVISCTIKILTIFIYETFTVVKLNFTLDEVSHS